MLALPRRYLPSLASLRALEALDRLGTATAAAQELSLTQSAVSRQLQHLEAQLGATLIQRDNRRMALTPAGTRYASQVREALTQIARASMHVLAEPGTEGLSLAILPSFGMRWLVPRLARFAEAHPNVPVNLATRLGSVDFDAEPFDAAICYGSGHWPRAQSLLLAEETLIPVCSPSLLSGPVAHPQVLSEMSLLHIQTRPNAWRDWLVAKGAPAPRSTGALFDQFSTITQAAIHGLGVALLPDFIAQSELAAGVLVPAYDGYTESKEAYYLVWPDTKARDPALGVFRDWIASQTDDNLPR